MAAKVTKYDQFRVLLVVVLKRFCIFCGDTSLSHMKQRILQEMEGISPKMLEKIQKNLIYRIMNVVMVNGGHIDQNKIRLKLLEYFYYNEY